MDASSQVLSTANHILARSGVSDPNAAERPPIFKVVGIILAVASGVLIGISFVLKKFGLLKANEKYSEEAGEGYGYLKNAWWWAGMSLMILGEICNFVAYAFTDAILVTPLGALAVVIATVLSAIFLKERLSLIGKIGCFLCVVGSTVIVLNAPPSSAVANIQQMQDFVIAPGFLSYAGVIIVGSTIAALYAGPRWGKKNMMVYISICSWVGGLSVVAIQGLGAAVIAQAGGTPQFNQWFLYVLLVFVIATLLTEIIYLNKALNIFNAALVTPTYFVYFTTATIISSIVLFRGFKGTPIQIITILLGFFTICSGVVLLQLSKSAKDVPDAAVFKGDLDQIKTIAEQEQPESEPKADAIRGTAAIVRRLSSARQKMELEELRRLHEEKMLEQLEPVSEDGKPMYEWDGLRRRRTVLMSGIGSGRVRSATSPSQRGTPFYAPFPEPERTPHPPLGMSHFPSFEELDEQDREPGVLSSIAGTIRSRARSIVTPSRSAYPPDQKVQSPMHPVPLTEFSIPSQKGGMDSFQNQQHGSPSKRREPSRGSTVGGSVPQTPPHSAGRQFSFQSIFRRQQASRDGEASIHRPASRHGLGSRGYSAPGTKTGTEEERLGLVTGDSQSMPALPQYDEEDEEKERPAASTAQAQAQAQAARYGRGITTPPRRGSDGQEDDVARYEAQRRRFNESSNSNRSTPTPPVPPMPPPSDRTPLGGDGAFI